MTYLIGIDDAGRGPVIGPMILAGVIIKDTKEENEKVKETGAKDSKLLAPKKRKEIAEKIKSQFKFHTEKSTPEEIDNCDNLNNLEAIKTAMIINKLSQDINENIIAIVDCPSVNTKAWGDFVFNLIVKKDKTKIKAEHKADFNYPLVSAASIIAKETREEEVEKLKKEFTVDFGSGYPSDPKTKDFILKNYDNPEFAKIIRHSWDTIKQAANQKQQKNLF